MAKRAKVDLVYLPPNSRYWKTCFTHPQTHKQIRVTTKTTIKEKAQQLAAKMLNEAFDQKHFNAPSRITIKELLDWYWTIHFSKKKTANRKDFDYGIASLLAKLGELIACDLTPDNIDSYVNERLMVDKVAHSSVNRELNYLRAAFRKAIKRKKLRDNPFEDIESFDESDAARSRIASHKEREMLMGHSAGLLHDCIEFDFNQGLRKGEMRALKWSDFNESDNLLRVISYKRKGNTIRFVPIMPGALAVIKRRHRIGEYIFCNEFGDPIPRYGILHSSFTNLVKRLAIADFNFHDIRHTFATNYYKMSGNNLRATQLMLGHTKSSTTERYLNLKPEDLSAGIVRLYPESQSSFITAENVISENRPKVVENEASAVSSVG